MLTRSNLCEEKLITNWLSGTHMLTMPSCIHVCVLSTSQLNGLTLVYCANFNLLEKRHTLLSVTFIDIKVARGQWLSLTASLCTNIQPQHEQPRTLANHTGDYSQSHDDGLWDAPWEKNKQIIGLNYIMFHVKRHLLSSTIYVTGAGEILLSPWATLKLKLCIHFIN